MASAASACLYKCRLLVTVYSLPTLSNSLLSRRITRVPWQSHCLSKTPGDHAQRLTILAEMSAKLSNEYFIML
ncbi:hypothetical protein HOY80DRAFT_1031803 [Tuber brumale]|nr:hypothetical protein HOY80DRAFT_1031803 [Tuber brumale]